LSTTLQFVDEITVDNPQVSSSARALTRLYFATFWAILLTGAIRKWVFPNFTALYLLQDVPIGIAYVYALWKGLFDRGQLLLGFLFLSAMLILQALAQIIFSGHDSVIAAIGLHNYLFYWPMILVFPIIMTPEVRRQAVKLTLLATLPMSAIALLQNATPKSSWINKTSTGDAAGIPGAEVARVSGTFNFPLYYGIWVAIAVAFCVGEWLLPKERRVFKTSWFLACCTFATNICYLVSASRTAILLAGVAIAGAMVAAFALRSTRAIAAMCGIVILLPLLAGLTYVISPAGFNGITERFTAKNNVDEGTNRVELISIGFLTEPQFSVLGAGIGMGVDAAHVGNANANAFTYALSEWDTIRTVMELGTFVGLTYIAIRFSFILAMLILAWRCVREGSSPHVLPLACCLLVNTFLGDLTRNATMTSSQVFLGYSFILGAYYYPDDKTTMSITAG
jgi:hypothetical protein